MSFKKFATMARCALVAAGVGVAPLVAPAAAPPAPERFFRTEELRPDVALCGKRFYIPTVFGPTGMNGWLLDDKLVVREVDHGSPADGIVLPNDILLAVNGEALGDEPLKTLGEQVEASERTGKMALLVQRAGSRRTLTIPLRKLGAIGRDWPFDCAKSRAIHRDACEYLARIQNPDGSFDGRIHVGFALNGLTWLAADDPNYWEPARRLAYGYRKWFDPEAYGTVNWGWAYMGVFLAEYYLKTGDHTVLPLCRRIAQTLARSQQPCGTWGHGPYPGKGYVQGGSLNNCGLVCWMALVLIRETGAGVPEHALRRATEFFARFAHRGTVPYGDHRPEFGGGNGKNAIPGVVYTILGDRAKREFCARMVTNSYRGRNAGHTGGYMGFVWGNVQGTWNPHYPDYRRMLDHWAWLMNVSRRWDGGFLLPESVIGSIYTYRGPVLATGGMAQVYAMPRRTLRIHGAPKGVFASRDLPAELARGVELYRQREFAELRKTVQPTGDLARQLLTAADWAEKDIERTFAKIDAAMAGGDPALARQLAGDLDRYTGGNHPGFEGMRWRLSSANTETIDLARKLYDRYRWLTYTHPKAREAFENLAADPNAGVYRALARRELATPPYAMDWTFFCELLYNEHFPDWRIDEKARAGLFRVAGIRGGNWPQVVALNTLHEAGALGDRLEQGWTPLAPPCAEGYPGQTPPWRALMVPEGQDPPAGWASPDFDDGGWQAVQGPVGSDGFRVRRGSVPHLRIPFQCARTDFTALEMGVRLRGRDPKAVVYLNGTPVLWSQATQGPRMRIGALVPIDLSPAALKRLLKGRNVLAVRVTEAAAADFGLYATTAGDPLAFQPRPKDWAPGPKMPAPDLTTKTPPRPKLTTVLPPVTTGVAVDVPGTPNECLGAMVEDFIGVKDGEPLGKTPPAERAEYFGHFDPRIRRAAAYSLMAEGHKAMPHILKALASKDVRVIRAGCDALAGNYRMNGRGMPHLREAMTPEISGRAVPSLLPLLKHEDVYVREGALMALANCGKAAAQHLPEITRLADDSDWWVRAGVSYVLAYVTEPETGDHAQGTVRNFRDEKSIFGKNRLREALVEMAKRGHGVDAIVAGLIADTKSEDGFAAGQAVGALGSIGYHARAAAGIFEERVAKAKARLAAARTDGEKKAAERNLRNVEGILRRMTTPPAPPRPPKRRKKQ